MGSEKVESSKEFIQSFETVPKKQSKIFTINQFDISEKDGLVIKITNQNKKDELKVFGFSEETNIKVDENFKRSRSLYKIISDQDIESQNYLTYFYFGWKCIRGSCFLAKKFE